MLSTFEHADNAVIPPGCGLLTWPDDEEGDVQKIWNRNNLDEVADARRSFDDLTKKGFTAYEVAGTKGERGKSIKKFDPDAERIILAPPMVGG